MAERVVSYLGAGGPLMFFILVDSVLLWFFAFRKLLAVKVKDADLPKALEAVSMGESFLSGFKGPKASFIREFIKVRTGLRDVDAGIIEVLSNKVIKEVERDMGVLEALCVSAPLLGLLGTVMGMIKVFSALTAFGTGNIGAIASGISEALITTQSGLVVAIPGFYMVHFLRKKIDELRRDILEIAISVERHL